MEKNNNSNNLSNSLVFGRWPLTKYVPFQKREQQNVKRKTQAAQCERPAIRWMIKQERFAVRFAAAAAAAAAASASDLKFSFSSVEIRFSWKTDIFRFFPLKAAFFSTLSESGKGNGQFQIFLLTWEFRGELWKLKSGKKCNESEIFWTNVQEFFCLVRYVDKFWRIIWMIRRQW